VRLKVVTRLAVLLSDDRGNAAQTAWKLYVCLIVPVTILLNLSFVNFHAPDDFDHTSRAYTLAHSPFSPVTPEGRSTGAMIDRGLIEYNLVQRQVVTNWDRPRAQSQARQVSRRVEWSGEQQFSELPGAMSYFPLLYVPQTLALEAGRLLNATIEDSVLWARVANGLCGIGLAALGLALMRCGHAIALVVLLMPRTLLQFASNSADPVLYGLALIVIGAATRMKAPDRWQTSIIPAALFISASVRPPMVALAIPHGLLALRKRNWTRLAVLAGACAAAGVWFYRVLPTIIDLRCGNLGSISQMLGRFSLEWPLLIGNTLAQKGGSYVVSFVGHFGWGDGVAGLYEPLQMWVYPLAAAMLGLAVWIDATARVTVVPFERLAALSTAFGLTILMFLALYAACTVPDSKIIAGVQGRYFAPVLFALAPALSGIIAKRAGIPFWFVAVLALWVSSSVVTMVWEVPELYGHT
jgi:uncharacterized membrane protein